MTSSDSRSPASLEKIKHAFLELIREEPLETITVRAVCTKAGISRALFYTYFESKYELLETIEQELISGFTDLMLDIRNKGVGEFRSSMKRKDSKYFIRYFEYIKAHQFEFKCLLCSKHPNGFSIRLSRAIMKTRLETTSRWDYDPLQTTQGRYREEILSAIYVSMFTTWLNNELNCSEDALSRLLLDLWRTLSSFGFREMDK